MSKVFKQISDKINLIVIDKNKINKKLIMVYGILIKIIVILWKKLTSHFLNKKKYYNVKFIFDEATILIQIRNL